MTDNEYRTQIEDSLEKARLRYIYELERGSSSASYTKSSIRKLERELKSVNRKIARELKANRQ